MSADHNHNNIENIDRNLKWGIFLNTGFTIFEFIIGISSGSLALVSDAGHNLTDSMSLVISFLASKIARRTATQEKTYGYGRATILAAMLNSLILIGLALYIFYEAYQRILHPEPVVGKLVAIVAFAGIIVNGTVALLFYKNKGDINIRSAFLNMAFDALASVGALVAGIIIIYTGKTMMDPIISIIIGVMLVFSAWSVVKDALHVLLDGVPEGVDISTVKDFICKFPGVKGVDDLHIWALSSQHAALSCHIIVEECSLEESIKLVGDIKEKLHTKFKIEHATMETELTEGPHENERTDEGI